MVLLYINICRFFKINPAYLYVCVCVCVCVCHIRMILSEIVCRQHYLKTKAPVFTLLNGFKYCSLIFVILIIK